MSKIKRVRGWIGLSELAVPDGKPLEPGLMDIIRKDVERTVAGRKPLSDLVIKRGPIENGRIKLIWEITIVEGTTWPSPRTRLLIPSSDA